MDELIHRPPADALRRRVDELSAILIDCVEGGASVSFMAPLSRERADGFWLGVADRVAAGASAVVVAEVRGRWVGTVQLGLAQPENQPHRADLAKMLVRRDARRLGVGRRLLLAAEAAARSEGKSLLVLDTSSDEAERLYRRLGWLSVGRVPGFALLPDGRPCDTHFFYRWLAPAPAA